MVHGAGAAAIAAAIRRSELQRAGPAHLHFAGSGTAAGGAERGGPGESTGGQSRSGALSASGTNRQAARDHAAAIGLSAGRVGGAESAYRTGSGSGGWAKLRGQPTRPCDSA